MNVSTNRRAFTGLAIAVALTYPSATNALHIDTVPVGNPGNAAQLMPQGTFGDVAYEYRIGKTEISNAQYVEFLNTAAKSDTYGLYSDSMATDTRGGIVRSGTPGNFSYAVKPPAIGKGPGGSDYEYANKPVVHVNWFDAVRFVNWLHNGQGSGGTESGAYTLLGGTLLPTNEDSVTRNAGAKWFLPSEDEWYKAAYYNPTTGTYIENATGSPIHPNNNLPTQDTGNSANHVGSFYTTGDDLYPLTDVGAYRLSRSSYGTHDQAGNVAEWTETPSNTSLRVRRGGLWANSDIQSQHHAASLALNETTGIGFRVATVTVPEPSTLALFTIGCAATGYRRRR